MELIANYKLYDSAGTALVYDYSGNGNHGEIGGTNHYITDRGLKFNSAGAIRLPTNGIKTSPGYSEFSLSYWYIRGPQEPDARYFSVSYLPNGPIINVNGFAATSKLILEVAYGTKFVDQTLNPPQNWNLYTFQLISLTPNSFNIKFYINLGLKFNCDLNGYSLLGSGYSLRIGDAVRLMYGILYEVWWYKDLSFQALLSFQNGKYCVNYPTLLCLPDYEGNFNSQNNACPSECTTKNLSCYNDLTCIHKSNPMCRLGLYQIQSKECLLYCPENSCNCSVSTVNGMSSFVCSCKEGFTIVSENPPACITSSCISYKKEGYKYICDKCGIGMKVGCGGECCECAEGYSAVSLNPLLCANLNMCLAYEVFGNEYACSQCSAGYLVDESGACNLCEMGYIKVSDNPITCIEEIKNCISYMNEEAGWRCSKCTNGYKLDDEGKCRECEIGYLLVENSCIAEIRNCIEYLTPPLIGCKTCDYGYDIQKGCQECEVGHVYVEGNPGSCIKQIEFCAEYNIREFSLICTRCESGYELDLNSLCILSLEDSPNPTSEIICPRSYQECIPETSQCEICKESESESETESISEPQYYINNDQITSSSENLSSAAIGSAGVASCVSMDPSTLVLYINTVKILSYIPDLIVSIPIAIQKSTESTNKQVSTFNIYKYIKIQGQEIRTSLKDAFDDEHSFIINSFYEILGLFTIASLNIISYISARFGRGKFKTIANRVLQLFRYNIYIMFFLMIYLDISLYALDKLTRPNEDKMLNILDYDIASVIGV